MLSFCGSPVPRPFEADDQVAPWDVLAWISTESCAIMWGTFRLATCEQQSGEVLTGISVHETQSHVTWKRSISPLACFKQTHGNSHPPLEQSARPSVWSNPGRNKVQGILLSDFNDKKTA